MNEIEAKRQELEDDSNNKHSYPDFRHRKFAELKGFNLGVEMARKEILDREKNMQCLNCGVSLHHEIMHKIIHIHLCKECRMKELEKNRK